MNSAEKRANELIFLRTYLEQGEYQKFFDLLFPPPEPHESARHRVTVEEILLSRKQRQILVEFATKAEPRLVNQVCGIIYENSIILASEAEVMRKKLAILAQGAPIKAVLVTSSQSSVLRKLHREMKQAQSASSIPPPASSGRQSEVKAA